MLRLNSKILTTLLLLLLPFTILASDKVTVKSGQYQTALLELYTSEGCSSCPPADRWFNQLTELPDTDLNVLALAFHVDYWDYIGWKDIYANPAYTNRQRDLARTNQQNSVYTPEFFVNGIEARGTSSAVAKIQSSNKTLSTVDLKLDLIQNLNTVDIHLSSQYDPANSYLIRFVVFENDLSSNVKSGENSGHQLNHQQVVRYLSPGLDIAPEIMLSKVLEPEWDHKKLGIGAIVKTKNGDYVQAISSRLTSYAK